MLARRGVNPFRIQSLGRWKSPLVIHYAGEALSTGLALELATSAPQPSVQPPAPATHLQDFVDSLDRRLAALESLDDIPAAAPTATRTVALDEPRLIKNDESGVFHASHTAPDGPLEQQVSVCGWWYAKRPHSDPGSIPMQTPFKDICPRCLRSERDFARAAEVSDVD